MKIVTGGAGFVGRHLASRLAADDEVVVLDNYATSNRRRGAELAKAGIRVIEHDVVQPPPDIAASQIYHLASPASPADYLRMPIETLRTGAEGTRQMLEHARRHDARFLLASTSEVYGDPAVHPQPEEYEGCVSLTGPRAAYDEAKRHAEALVHAYHRTYGLETRVARIFNTYGPGMRSEDGRVVSTFIHRCLQDEPLPVHGEGTQTRSFCYVDDMVRGLMTLMESSETRPVNMGNPEEVTILDLARVIQKITQRQVGIKHLPLPENDPVRRRPDISRAKSSLGWRPEVSLEEGLRRYADSLIKEVLA